MRTLACAAALLVGAACSQKPEVRAKLDDGVAVRAAYVCRKGSGAADEATELPCRLELATQPALALPVPLCDAVELAEDASGTAVGHRCAGRPWSIVRLRGARGADGPRYLQDCNAPVGDGPKPDWSKLGAIEPRAMALLDCASGDAIAWAEIARAIAEDSGPELAAKFVVATTLRPPTIDRPRKHADGWTLAFDSLPAPAQVIVRKEVCPALQNASSSSVLYTRAALRCPHDGANVGEIALQAYRNHLAASRRDFGGSLERSGAAEAPTDLTIAELGFVMEALIALEQRPKEAAQASCERIGEFSRQYDPVRVAVSASVLARSKTRCPALDANRLLWPCELASAPKSKISEHVARFASPAAGASPALPSSNEALFEALTIDGQYPKDWACP